MNNEIYLDANATCATLPVAVEAAVDVMAERFGNPSSSHATGIRAKRVLDEARACARRVIGAGGGRLMFTSGATEGIQTAVVSALAQVRERQLAGQPCGTLLVYGATDHKAVPESLAHWNRLLGTKLELACLPVDGKGRHRLDVLRALAPEAALVCTMAANNETGVVSDLAGIEAVMREEGREALWMVDCVQALGKLPLALADTRIDYAPFSGHKLSAPKGIGMLYVREGAPFTPLIAGGGQEGAQRSGTENMAGIAAFGAVLKALEQGGVFRSHGELAAYRERIVLALREAFPGIVFNAPFDLALPTTINFSVPGLASREVLDLFDATGVRVSAGSACSASKAQPSYVLQAMQLPAWRATSAVRLSFGPQVDAAFIDAACQRIVRCGAALRADPLALSGQARGAGVLQMSCEGRAGWLVFEQREELCVAIDPPAALAARIAALARSHGYAVRAVLTTEDDAQARAGCDALCSALAESGVLFEAGWPRQGASVRLGDASVVPAIRIGDQWLARVAQGEDAFYLLGAANGPDLPASDVRFAFIGGAQAPGCAEGVPLARMRGATERLASLVNADTALCRSVESDTPPWSTPAALAHGGGVLGSLLAVQPLLCRPALAGVANVLQVEQQSLERFLATHPDAVLVDVREPAEHAAGPATLHGRAALNVPMSRLAEQAGRWLRDESRPLVFVCRSGNRSARAALQLQRIGYAQAWHLSGGMALAT
ncbi:aminotransferase class V-fold PLP-dependent enzyme [Massilia solisilvae]|uniref:cysteine desulfurase n=1 Tax=Massilia solisilvae TaxID=1811225 RepID=A0ABT2BQU9_9BURK|nr:aminotransferase class V-fold PLP-dependent enzyme [Massilia solisilvae]MCS0610835.1 aminotransferase class V-fold PLP-dependent enzyme [Massilia solisilvae]